MKKIFLLSQLFFLTGVFSQATLNFTVTSTEGFTITCSNPSLSLTATSDFTASPVNYTWTGPGGPYTGSVLVVSTSGNYQVLAQSGALTSTQVVSIATNTLAPISIGNPTFQTVLNSPTAAPTITVTTISPTVSLTQFLYSPIGGTAITNLSYVTYTLPTVGIYTHCTLYQINGCTSCILFTVEFQDPTTGISKSKDEFNAIKIFPNPANELLNLQADFLPNDLRSKITLSNHLGQVIREEEITFRNKSAQLNISGLDTGMYSLRLTAKDNVSLFKKFLKE